MIRSNSLENELREIMDLLERDPSLGSPESHDETSRVVDTPATPAGIDTARIERCLAQLLHYRVLLQQEPSDAESLDENAPVSIDRFTIVNELGRGGCGVVFLARDPDLNRLVALKVPHPAALVSPELRRRFVTEARASANLEHPAIIRVYEVGSSGALSWIAAEYCNGCTLQAYLEKTQLLIAPRIAAETIRRLAEAIDYAHRRGVLHRDLKPANILLAPRTEQDAVNGTTPQIELADCDPKLTDFGLAKILTESTTATMTMLPMGTPAYMSPEQIAGNSTVIGTGCDIYALGIILYEMLAGVPAFRGATREETWKRIIHDELQPIKLFRQDVPRDLEAIVARATEKSPAARYKTAAELAEDLGRFLRGEPTLARPLGHVARSQRWVRRHPAVSGIVATMIIAAGLLIGGGVWHLRAIEDELRIIQALRETGNQQLEELRHTAYLKNLEEAHGSLAEAKLENAKNVLTSYLPKNEEPDRRDFVWHHLWRRCHHEAFQSLQHQATVSALAYSPNGRILAAGDHASKIQLSDKESGEILTTLTGHVGNINALAFQGEKLLSGADDGCVIVWNSNTFEQMKKMPCHEGDLLCLAVHPTEPWVATGGVDAIVRLWNFETGKLLQEFKGEPLWIRGIGFSPDGQRLLSTGHEGVLRCWNLQTGELHWKSWNIDSKFHALAVNFQKNTVYVGGHSGAVFEHRISDGEVVDSRQTDMSWIRSLTVCPRNQQLIVSSNSGRLRVWNIEQTLSRDPIFDFPAHEKGIWAVAYSPTAGRFATGSADSQVKVWNNDPQRQQGFQTWSLGILGATRAVRADFSTGVVTVVGSDALAQVSLRDFGKMTVSQMPWPEFLEDAAIDRSQSLIVLNFSDRLLKMFDLREQRYVDDLKFELHPDDNFTWHPDGKSLGIMRRDQKFLLWNMEEQKAIAEYHKLPESKPRSLRFSPNGRFAAMQYDYPRKVHLVEDRKSVV